MDRKRFTSLWQRCARDGVQTDADRVFDIVCRSYNEPGRRYHTPAHIDHCLHHFDMVTDLMDDPDAVEVALWFHDVVYEARANDNEARSAQLFLDLAGDDFPEPFRRRVHDLIMITTHRTLPHAKDECYVVDIDLSSFGLPWDQFTRDGKNVRDEFPYLTDEEFYPRQKVFLESLLARETFCFTEFFRERYERSARENIRRHLDALRQRGLIGH